jgi:peptidyl-prolyl cis-trans isomerase D
MYARQKDRFYVPGKRVLAYISFDGNTLKDLLHAGVSEDELRTRYESQKDLYKQAELRSVEQFNFADKADAEAGEAALKEGKAPHEPVKLGEVAKDDLPDSVAGAVFKLKAGSITPPVESEFGWQIYRVSSITPAMTLPFSDVRDDIETAAIADMMEDRLNELAEALDDQLAQGATLEEALKANGLSELKITKLSVSEDTQAEGLEAEVLASGADLEEGEVSPVLLSSEHVYYLVKADSVTEGYTKAYDDVKGELEKLWRGQQERDLMRAKAQEVAGELRSSEDMIGAIANTGLDTVMSGDLQRDDETIGNIAVTGGLMTEIFRMPKYGVSDAYPLPGGEYAVAVVTDIKEAPRDAAAEAQLGSTIALAQRDAMFEAYLSALRKHYHVEVNVDLLMADMAQQGE